MSEQNKALVRKVVEEVWNRGDFAVVDELVARDYVGHSSVPGDETHGPDGYKQFFAMLRRGFPDIHFTIEDEIAEGDRVMTRWTARGAHAGEFQGIPPTGRHGAVAGVTIYRVANGKIVECWTHVDMLGLLQQLGVMPAPAPAAA